MQREIAIDQAMIDRYGRINGDNDIIHYDHDYAVKRGFRGTLLHGPHMSAFVMDVAVRKLGADWLRAGKLYTRWVGPVCPGDVFHVEIDDNGDLRATSNNQPAMTGRVGLRPA